MPASDVTVQRKDRRIFQELDCLKSFEKDLRKLKKWRQLHCYELVILTKTLVAYCPGKNHDGDKSFCTQNWMQYVGLFTSH